MDKKCYQMKNFSHNFLINLGLFYHFSTGSQKRTSKQIYNGDFLETTLIMLSSVVYMGGEGRWVYYWLKVYIAYV